MLLEKRFKMHYLKNAAREILEAKAVYGRDFYTMHKVDNHVHLAACMS